MSTTRRNYTAIWTAAASAALMLGAAFLLAPAAFAGHFHLYTCSDPSTHAPLPADGWRASGGESVGAACEISGGFPLYTNFCPGCAPQSLTFDARSGLTMTGATIYREGFMNRLAQGWWATPENPFAESGAFEFCQGIGTQPETLCKLGEQCGLRGMRKPHGLSQSILHSL
jgi:hypothetical protein